MPINDIRQIIQEEIARFANKGGIPINPVQPLRQSASPNDTDFPVNFVKSVPFTVTSFNRNRNITVTDTTIAFNDNDPSDDTITDSNNGLAVFNTSNIIRVTGTTNNNGEYVPATVAAGTITLAPFESLNTEAAGTSFTLTQPVVPVLDDFIHRTPSAPGQSSDGFNEVSSWIRMAESGILQETFIPQYTNRRYSTYLYSDDFDGGKNVLMKIIWGGLIRVLITNDNGVTQTIYASELVSDKFSQAQVSGQTRFETMFQRDFSIPIKGARTRLDILIYNDVQTESDFTIKMRNPSIFGAAAPLPQMRMGKVQKVIEVLGDGAWHDDVEIPVSVTDTTISFDQTTATASTVSFVDPFTHDNNITFAATTITRTSGSFVTDGFEPNMDVTVGGSASNDSTFSVTNVTALTLTISGGVVETGDKFKFITIKGQPCIKDSLSGFGSFSDTDEIKVTGSSKNDGEYTIDDATAGILVLDSNDQLENETFGSSITVKKRAVISDSGSGFGDFSNGDPIRVIGTVSNNGTYVVETAAAGSLTLEFGFDLTTEAAGTSFTITSGGITHHADSDGINFRVRDTMLVKTVVDMLPGVTRTPTVGQDIDKQGVAIADPVIHGNTDNESAHTHTADGTLATDSDSHSHGGSVSGTTGSGGDPSHTHSFSDSFTTDSDNHSHDVTGNTSAGSAHNHTVNTINDTDLDLDDVEIVDNGSKTHKDQVDIPNESFQDPADDSFAEVEVVEDSDNFVEPALDASLTATTISFNDVKLTGATFAFTAPLVERNNEVSFTASTKKITRSDVGGDWTTDGFEAGMRLRVLNSQRNNGVYLIDSVTSTEITLDSGETLIDEPEGFYVDIYGQSIVTDSLNGFITGGLEDGMSLRIFTFNGLNEGDYIVATVVSAGKIRLALDNNVDTEAAGKDYTIYGQPKISDTLSQFVTKGFTADTTLTVTGAGNSTNNNTFTIKKVNASYLLLDVFDTLADEAIGASVTLASTTKEGFRVRYKVANGKTARISYQVMAWGFAVDKPANFLA